MMYKIDPVLFNAFLKAVNEVSGEVRVNFGEQIVCRAVDIANSSFIEAVLTPEEYTGDPIDLQVDISRMKELPVDSSLPITLSFVDHQLTATSGRVKFKIPLFVDAAVRKAPDPSKIPFPFGIKISPELINEGVAAVKSLSDTKDTSSAVRFTFDPTRDKHFIIYDRNDECEVVYSNDEYTIIAADTDRSFNALYSLDYVSPYVRILKNFSLITVKYGTDTPLLIGGKSPKLSIAFIVAPRIEQNS